MRKLEFCMCDNKDTDQLHSNCEADQRLCFCYIDITIPLPSKSEISSRFCTAWFVSDQVINQNVGFLMTQLIWFSNFLLQTQSMIGCGFS